MIKDFFLLATIATVLFHVGCSDEITPPLNEAENNIGTERVISLTTTIPGESQIRIALGQEEKNIALTWEEGDTIQLSFIQQGDTKIKIKQKVEVKNITPDGKTASFDIILPDGIEGDFKLYG